MSEPFYRRNQEDTLRRIQERLSQGATPALLIAEMLPQSRDKALFWGRRLALWDEYRADYPAQTIALARLISRQAMKASGLTLRKDGRVVERTAARQKSETPNPAAIFTLAIGGEEVRVEYTPAYFPNDDTALVYYVSSHDPPKAHALSDSGYFLRFVPHDAVEACGGPQAYAAMHAEAILAGEEQAFIETFEGPLPVTDARCREENRPRLRPAHTPSG